MELTNPLAKIKDPPLAPPLKGGGFRSDRLLSLDVMRGATIMGMILVNNPGSWGHMYWPLAHARWHGWTPTDLIFPFFVFMVGVSMAYSFRKFAFTSPSPVPRGGVRGGASDAALASDNVLAFQNPPLTPPCKGGGQTAALLKVIRRTVILILLGLLLNSSGQWLGLLAGERSDISFATIRLPGVLQRIALAYLGASLVVLYCPVQVRWLVGVALLVGYAALLLLLPRDETVTNRLSPAGNIVRVVDLAVLGPNHMYTQARDEMTDPEGLLSTLPAIVTALLGFAVGRYLQRDLSPMQKVLKLLAAGILLAAAGQAWHYVDPASGGMPINKKLWTSSFVLLTAGLGTIALVACLWLFDMVGSNSRALNRVATAFQMVGVNAIFVFVASGIGARVFSMIPWGATNLKAAYYQTLFVGPLGNNELASLGFAASMVAFWWFVLWLMWRKGWSIRV
jgi:predicted acyltransferase